MTTMKKQKMRNKTSPLIHVYTPTLEHALAAIKAGVSIISLNGPDLSLRGDTSFLTWEQVAELVNNNDEIAVYLRVNTVIHNQDLEILGVLLERAEMIGMAGIIYSDIAVLQRAKNVGITLPMLLETETTVTNIEMIRFWSQQGVTNFLLSRELGMDQLKDMVEKKRALEHSVNVQFTVQIHGPVGIFHTLRPVLSNYNEYLQVQQTNGIEREAGSKAYGMQGEQTIVEEMRPDEVYRIIEDSRGSYIFAAYDISLYEYLRDLTELQIDVFKIDIFDTQSVESMVQVIEFYQRAVEHIQVESYVVKSDWMEQLQSRNQYPIHNQFIKIGAPQ